MMASTPKSEKCTDTYEEDMKKVTRLEIEEFVFTSDSEIDPQRKALSIENSLKTKKLSVTQNTKQIMRSVYLMDVEPDENCDPENSTTDSSDSGVSNKNKKIPSSSKRKQEVHKKRKQENTTIPSSA
ncbi:uncharacterized protein LOC117179375 [Belonocnema kinseyi]|uniref:uncharacterized protein LOC117179375 n=1 Tax=Belonocnema kinseyi TaxID=2817044 RepID=UPI00143D4D92|nr:uncharacterized protein LOC117179375 [Belonocnema kinseyi]